MNLVEFLDQVKPLIVRRLAKFRIRKGWRAKTAREMAAESGLSIATIKRLSNMRSFAGVSLHTIEAYCKAAGHDPLNPRASLRYIERFLKTGYGFQYLNKPAQKKFAQLLKL